MLYPFDLKQVGLVLGLALILGHAVALAYGGTTQKTLIAFPRSRVAGIFLVAAAAAWSLYLVLTMDLGEFSGLRNPMAIGVVVGAILAAIYVPEFLAVRALGMLALLAAEPILGAAFLRPETSKVLAVLLAYAWILGGLFWVGMPWLLRDQIQWATKSSGRFQTIAATGLVYGIAITACALMFW
ncbi:MAG: hypothetical protein WEB60_14640 [Terrimicrobiaceae bacterium]